VEGLEWTGEVVDEGPTRLGKGVSGSVNGRDKEIEAESPVRQDGEVAERVAGLGAATHQTMRAAPSNDEKECCEDVE
jgi:hypothetical protein